jgi:hypothetical protein
MLYDDKATLMYINKNTDNIDNDKNDILENTTDALKNIKNNMFDDLD